MSEFLLAGIAVIAGFGTTALSIPFIQRFAVHRKLLDYPDGDRRRHAQPVPRLGGVGVFLGIMAAVVIAALTSPKLPLLGPWREPGNVALLVASIILFFVGLLDDLRGVSPPIKLLVQTIAAAVVVFYGFEFPHLRIVAGVEVELGVLAAPLAVVWLVGVSNAFNLVDGLDGLAGGVGIIALTAVVAASAVLGNLWTALYSLALIGALLGFLRYNRAPARIFLGDSGSLVVGFLLAVFSVKGATDSSGVTHALVPIFALSYLLLDTGIAMLRRWLRGEPLSRADGRHIHHRLLGLGLGPTKAVRVIYAQALFVAVLGLCVTFVPPAMTIAIGAVGLAILLFILVYGVRWLEYHEFLEAGASLASGMRKGRRVIRDRIMARDLSALVAAADSLESMRRIITEHADVFRFQRMELHFPGEAVREEASEHSWRLDYPIPLHSSEQFGLDRNLVLSIWCPISPGVRAANAERVAEILAPAISAALGTASAATPPSIRRVVEESSTRRRARGNAGMVLEDAKRGSTNVRAGSH